MRGEQPRAAAKSTSRMAKSTSRMAGRIVLIVALVLGFSQCRTDKAGEPGVRARKGRPDPFATAGALNVPLSDGQFKFKAGPKPPKRVGERLNLSFPPPAKPAQKGPSKVSAPPLKVLRAQPHGAVGMQNAVTVTFNQPMIPLASLEDLRKLPAPLLVKPALRGKHRWLGTRTLSLEVTSRIPFSTKFTAWVPQATTSEAGKVLEKKYVWTFETPRLKITRALPHRYEHHAMPTTPIALLFNQRIDVEKVMAVLRLTGKNAPKLRLVPRSRWKKLGPVGVTASRWEKGRVLVVKPVRALAKAQRYTLRIKQGLVAGEGPLPTHYDLTTHFTTYGPLKVTRVRCGWSRQVCRPDSSKRLYFTNRIKSAVPTKLITVAPKVKNYRVSCNWRSCNLQGEFKAQTKYKVTARPGIEDIYEQKLGKRWRGSFFVGDARPQLRLPVSGIQSVTESKGNRKVVVRSINTRTVTANLVRVAPRHAAAALKVMGRRWHYKYRKHSMLADIPGRKLSKQLVFNPKKNKWRRTGIPTDLGLGRGKPGLLFMELYAPDLNKASRYANPYRRLLVQVTDLGLTVRYDVDRLLVLVTGLQSGKPLPGVDVTLYAFDGKKLHSGRTDPRGILEAPGPRRLKRKGSMVVVATRGDDAAYVELQGGGQSGWAQGYRNYGRLPSFKRVRSHLFTERNPYRPGETVRLTGVLRVEDTRVGGGIEPLRGKDLKVKYWIRDARYQQVVKAKELRVDADGVFRLDFKVPEGASLGNWQFRGTVLGTPIADGKGVYHSFQVLHYKTPEYKVSVKARGEPYFFGDTLQTKIAGSYFHGTAMAGAPVKWTLRRSVGSFRPPHHSSFRFGELRDWAWRWRYHRGNRGGRHGTYYTRGHQSGGIIARGDAKLDKDGLLRVARKLAFWPKPKKGPGQGIGTVGAFTLEAEVFDKNRQSIAGRKVVTVHPAAVYVGMRMKTALVRAKKDAVVQVVLTNLKGKRQAGKRLKIIATQQTSKRKAKKVRGKWTFEYKLTEKIVGGCSVTTSPKVTGCKIRLPKAGYYRVRAQATDAKGRRTRTAIGVYAVGKRYVPWKQNNSNRLELISDKTKYRPGETAKILIKSPFRKSVGLLTVERNGIKSYRLLRVSGSVHVERVKIGAKDLPNLHVSVALVRGRVRVPGAAAAKDLGRPKFAVGSKSLSVDVKEKRLTVTVKAAPGKARPGSKATVKVTVRDHAGKPVQARLAVMLVDEGVLSLLGFRVPDPTTIFHNHKSARAALRDGRADLIRQEKKFKPPSGSAAQKRLSGRRSRNGAGMYKRGKSKSRRFSSMGSGGAPKKPAASRVREAAGEDKKSVDDMDGNGKGRTNTLTFKTRSKFASTAYFNAKAKTDSGGQAELSVKLPENLTTFRVTVVALDQVQTDRFGRGEGRVTVRRPLMLMPSLPRFANFGDRFEAAVKITNETGKAGKVRVKIQTGNAKVLGQTMQTITLRQGQTEEVRFPVSIGTPGRARFRFLAYLGRETDAVELSIPVNLPATTEAFATYGVTSDSVSQPVLPPKNALRSFGGLEMSFSSTALTGMEDAVKYLINYPWECTEQTASRVMPIFALRKILPAFRLLGKRNEDGDQYLVKVPERFLKRHKGKKRAEIERQYLEFLARDGIAKLLSNQRYDGGFGYWGGSRRTWPYPTAYATYALLRGREAGYRVPDAALSKAARYLSNFLNYSHWWSKYHWYYSWTMRAMAAWVLSEMKDQPYIGSYLKRRMKLKKHLAELFKERKKLPLFAKAMLLSAIHRVNGKTGQHAELRRLLNNAAIQDTPYKVHYQEHATESLRLLMHSESRTDAIVLASLMEVQPTHPLVPKIVRGLIEARVRGRWETTQANAYALVALSKYYKHYEKVVPDYRLRVWLGEGYVGQTGFRGRSMRVVEQKIPMAFIQAQGRKPLILEKKGKGKLYYRLGLRYAPKSLRLSPEEQGFSVQREYEPVEGKDTVVKLPGGKYRIQAGKYVRVRLRIVVPSRRYFVAVDDPLPAGLEAVDLNLRTSASSRLAGKAKSKIYDFRSWYAFFAFSHKEKRDDRVVLFSDRLPSGVYEYTYLARATTIGTFVVPPLKASEMYHPEVFGRNGTKIVEIVK
jgi:alpha-2-macroglobulin